MEPAHIEISDDSLALLSSRAAPDRLYHYTSASGVQGIVCTREVWATVMHYLNDAQEFRFAIELVGEALRRRAAHTAYSDVANHCTDLAEALPQIRDVPICVFSLTERGNLLSQWRAYCPIEGGYAIGLPSAFLKDIATRHRFVLAPCVYSKDDANKLIDHLLETIIRTFRGLPPHERNGAARERLVQEFFHRFARLAPLLKHPSFSEEREWRLVSEVIQNRERMAFRPGRGMLVPYCPLSIADEGGTVVFDDVVVGPNPYQRLSYLSMLAFLTSRPDLRIGRVSRSRIPYRPL